MNRKSNKPFKTAIFSLFCILINLSVLEFCVYFFVKAMRDKHSFDLKTKIVTREVLSRSELGIYYNKTLGWKNNYPTKFGERPRAREYSNNFMSAFGDSFTHCSDFGDHVTFQEYLSEMLKVNIYNFGNGGYGTDQAYLRFIEDYPKVKTKIVTLGIIRENINRIVNTYRKFYIQKPGLEMTKPRFKIVNAHELYHSNNGDLVLIKNPLKDVRDYEKLADVNSLPRIGKFDYYYHLN